ncbi:hypothetical protein RKD35_002841 [Streptomyces albogriseolus]
MITTPNTAAWFVVRGASPGTDAVDPGQAGVTVPDEVLDWAAGHGLDEQDPDVYLLVAPADVAPAELLGEVARHRTQLPPAEMRRVRRALATV